MFCGGELLGMWRDVWGMWGCVGLEGLFWGWWGGEREPRFLEGVGAPVGFVNVTKRNGWRGSSRLRLEERVSEKWERGVFGRLRSEVLCDSGPAPGDDDPPVYRSMSWSLMQKDNSKKEQGNDSIERISDLSQFVDSMSSRKEHALNGFREINPQSRVEKKLFESLDSKMINVPLTNVGHFWHLMVNESASQGPLEPISHNEVQDLANVYNPNWFDEKVEPVPAATDEGLALAIGVVIPELLVMLSYNSKRKDHLDFLPLIGGPLSLSLGLIPIVILAKIELLGSKWTARSAGRVIRYATSRTAVSDTGEGTGLTGTFVGGTVPFSYSKIK